MVFRHMFRDSAVLPRSTFQAPVRGNAVVIIEEQLRQKNKSLKVEDDFQRKAKLIQFGQSRGYELNILLLCCDKIVNKK